jgi:hypothetical protein
VSGWIVDYQYEVHNLVLGMWYKAGLFGLVGILVMLYAVFKVGWRAVVEARNESERMTAAALLSAVAAFVVFAMSEPVLFSRYGWIPAALLLALRAVQVREQSPQHSAAERPQELSYVPAGPRSYGMPQPSSGLNPA